MQRSHHDFVEAVSSWLPGSCTAGSGKLSDAYRSELRDVMAFVVRLDWLDNMLPEDRIHLWVLTWDAEVGEFRGISSADWGPAAQVCIKLLPMCQQPLQASPALHSPDACVSGEEPRHELVECFTANDVIPAQRVATRAWCTCVVLLRAGAVGSRRGLVHRRRGERRQSRVASPAAAGHQRQQATAVGAFPPRHLAA